MIELGASESKTLVSHLQKLDDIFEQIVNVKINKLIDEEHTLEEEVDGLKEALCILLKFFDITSEDSTPILVSVKFFSISYQEAMQCTAEEFETILERLFN